MIATARRILLAVFLVLPLQVGAGSQGTLFLSTPEDLVPDIMAAPCKREDRLVAVQALFKKMGALPDDMTVEKIDGVENVVVRIQGSTDETLVVGAHFDKARPGCGAIDNWTGVVAVAHAFRSLKSIPRRKTILCVAFGREEEGLLGSKAMVKRIKKEDVEKYCGMVNIDSLGLAAPQVMTNTSSDKLTAFTEKLAEQMKIPFAKAAVENADADSSSFKNRKIPAVTIHGLSDGFWKIIHTDNDKVDKVNPASVYLGYRLALAVTARLDESPCGMCR